MRIATWNVNSLNIRLEKVGWWLDRARPDVLLLQETKSSDAEAPVAWFRERGYTLAHHGTARWNGVAIASKTPLTDVVTNFGLPLARGGAGEEDEPLAEARMISARTAGLRLVNVYAPNGRTVDSPFYRAKLAWYGRLAAWIGTTTSPEEPLLVGGDLNIAPTDLDVWDATACHGGTHVSPPEREVFAALCNWGLVDAYRALHPEPDRYTWWDYRAGMFHKNFGMRIDHLLVTRPVAARVVFAEIDREARKGTPTPSDHAPLLIDLDEPGAPVDPGWAGVDLRVAERRAKKPRKKA